MINIFIMGIVEVGEEGMQGIALETLGWKHHNFIGNLNLENYLDSVSYTHLTLPTKRIV